MRGSHTRWATEAEAIEAFKLGEVGHCESCHADGVQLACEVTLPDGRIAEVCCVVAFAIPTALQ